MKLRRAEILGQIKAYEAQIAHAKHDLAHANATIELLAAPERQRARYRHLGPRQPRDHPRRVLRAAARWAEGRNDQGPASGKPARGCRRTTRAGSAMVSESLRIINLPEEIEARIVSVH
ncbi:hypothetical protein GQF56_21670 [Rhodobacter sphaeroides]|uniref:hypothetical protein n=1 Tax=Cereibacter sphaeroides TaxID=1063 RepID=UPI000ADC8B2E|nr:hypothetical protein [Cereibacter sphaeroides]QHA12200.1 hypothetical protein GQR99_21760 [Cereibacter sphaeroides]